MKECLICFNKYKDYIKCKCCKKSICHHCYKKNILSSKHKYNFINLDYRKHIRNEDNDNIMSEKDYNFYDNTQKEIEIEYMEHLYYSIKNESNVSKYDKNTNRNEKSKFSGSFNLGKSSIKIKINEINSRNE